VSHDGLVAKRGERKHLLEGRGVLTVAQVAALTRVRKEDIAALAESNSLDGCILNEDRTAWAFFEDEAPTRHELLRLGAQSLSESDPDPVDELPQGEDTVSWEMRW
jgi:hypothetical protein